MSPRIAGLRWQSPAGERVSLHAIADSRKTGQSGCNRWIGFQSGTAALAAALAFGRQKWGVAARVALPAYSCPSLIAAAVHAGLEPEFLDVEPAELSPSPARHAQVLADRCRIIVLVDLFGVPAPVEGLLSLSGDSAGWLVHDRAQSLIDTRLEPESRADAVITSLGRGKPVSLLGGGAAWCRAGEEFRQFAQSTYRVAGWNRPRAATKATLYNLALQPIVYGLAARMPGLGVGETRLVPLRKVERLPESWLRAAACQADIASSMERTRRDRCATLVEIALHAAYEVPASVRESVRRIGLNRLPILCRTADVARSLCERGRQLGLSPMYGRTLPEFFGQTEKQAARDFPHAYDLSRRLVTLPTHSRLSDDDLAMVRRLLDDCR